MTQTEQQIAQLENFIQDRERLLKGLEKAGRVVARGFYPAYVAEDVEPTKDMLKRLVPFFKSQIDILESDVAKLKEKAAKEAANEPQVVAPTES
jgi:peptidoglycan hydrolase CwlO-like protein